MIPEHKKSCATIERETLTIITVVRDCERSHLHRRPVKSLREIQHVHKMALFVAVKH